MLYANPILYMTAFFAIAVIALFSIQIDSTRDEYDNATSSMAGFSNDENNRVMRAIWILLLTMVYLVAIRIQFASATAVFLGSVLYVLGEEDWRILTGYSIVLTSILYAVFVFWLNIPL
jgi:hypothetical protein